MRLSTLIRILFFLLPLAADARDDQDFIVYEAQTRPAEELKNAAAGIMNGARISVLNNKVVIYGTSSQRNAVLRLFAELDHPLQNFTVSLRVASRGSAARDASALEANVNGKNALLRKKSGVLSGKGTGTVGIAADSGSVSASAESSSASNAANDGQHLTVMDGGTGRLYADSGIFPKAVTVHLRSIGRAGAHVEIREADSNAVGEQAIVTVIDVPLGEWRTVGGIASSSTGRNGELLGHVKRSSMSSRDVQVKVDLEAKD